MKGIINKIINFYQMQAEALNVLLANTQKALEQSEEERKADEQAQRVENFVRNLTMDLNNMLAKFYFLKDRKNRRQEQMTDRQAKAITEFAVFAKTLTKNVCSLLKRFQEGRTFEEKIDKEIRELEAGVGRRLKEFDEALDETNGTLTIRLIKFARDIVGSFTKLIQVQRIYLTMANSRKADRPLPAPVVPAQVAQAQVEKSTQNISEESPARTQGGGDNKLENIFSGSSIKSANSDEKRSKCLMHLKV
jgi:hypothetical protein